MLLGLDGMFPNGLNKMMSGIFTNNDERPVSGFVKVIAQTGNAWMSGFGGKIDIFAQNPPSITGQVNPSIAMTGSARIEDIEMKETSKKKMKKVPLPKNPSPPSFEMDKWYWIHYRPITCHSDVQYYKELKQCKEIFSSNNRNFGTFSSKNSGFQNIEDINAFLYVGKMRMKYYIFGEEVPLI